MLDNKKPEAGARQAGFTLIELMVAIVLGLIITAAVTAMTVNNLKISGDTLKSARLNQDLGAVMQIMVNDIRRAGYGGNGGDFPTNHDINIVSSSCILYSYDRDLDSNIKEPDEMNGFKLDGGSIQMRTLCNLANCPIDCSLGTWVDMTDPDIINVTGFELNSENSKCYNEDNLIRIKPGVYETTFACNATSDDNEIEEWDVDDASWGGLDDNLDEAISSSGTTSAGVRHVNISLEAELTKDSSVSKNLDVSIKVRNDHIYN